MPFLITVQMLFVFYRDLMNNLEKFSASSKKDVLFLKWKFGIYNKTDIKLVKLTLLIFVFENM